MFAPEGDLIATPEKEEQVGEDEHGGSERVLLLSIDLAIEVADTEIESGVWGAHPAPYGPPRQPTTELCGRSGHHSRLGFAPKIAKSEPKPRPADGVAGVR